MADEKLTDLPSVTPATGDLLYLVDISDTTDSAAGSSKKTTVGDVLALVSGGGVWGSITGTLSAQTDLQSALDARQPLDADLTSWAAVTRASGYDTFAGTPSSANLAALLTDETGSGAAVFGTGPTLTAPVISGTTAGRVLIVGSGGVPADDAGLTYDPATDTLALVGPSGTALVASTGAGGTAPYLEIGQGGTISGGSVRLVFATPKLGLARYSGGSPVGHFVFYSTTTGDSVLDCVFGGASTRISYLGTTRVQVTSTGVVITGPLTLGTYTVATLPSAAANSGAFAQVTDASSTTNGGTVAGGGSNRVPVFSDGTNWIVK